MTNHQQLITMQNQIPKPLQQKNIIFLLLLESIVTPNKLHVRKVTVPVLQTMRMILMVVNIV